jgi:chorismate mutase
MVADLKQLSKTLYDTDYNLWVIETVKQLQEHKFENLDLENLIEEVSDLSRRDKNKLESLLTRLFEHLLKLRYWESEREDNKGHWEGEIINFRIQIKRQLKASPSLKHYFREIFDECYQSSRKIAAKRTQLPLNTFPSSPIGNIEQILDENWLPFGEHP